MTDTAIAGSFRQDAEVVGLVSGGHFMSHYYSMMLPPLFPFLHDDLGVSYTMLGLLLSLKHMAGGATQLPAGILVDKYGARSILMVGFAIIVGAYFVIAVTTSFWILALMLIFAGCGNAVFHPADYSIINGTITEARLGRSFSFHTFAGHLGSAVAPTSVIVGLVIIAALATRWTKMQEGVTKRMSKNGKKQVESLSADTAEEAIAEMPKEPSTWELLLHIMRSPAVIFLFIFFAMQSLGSGGLRAFSVSALVTLHGTPAAAAGGALTGFLFASALGVLAGGVVADKNNRHDLVAGGALLLTALICVLVAKINLHYALLVFVFTLAGLIQGIIRPARDMMIRAATPKGSMGKVVGLVFSGQAIGGAIAPVAYGFLIDIGSPEMVFYSSGVFMVLCAGAVYGSYRDSRNKAAAGISA
jgi:FSR family fosmidomycin resistance protein-like MFS transporter